MIEIKYIDEYTFKSVNSHNVSYYTYGVFNEDGDILCNMYLYNNFKIDDKFPFKLLSLKSHTYDIFLNIIISISDHGEII